MAAGTNPAQSDKLASGAAPPEDFIRMWSFAGRLGFGF
jgi:hypothetical protein